MAESEDNGRDLEGCSVGLLDSHRQSSFRSKRDKMPDMELGAQTLRSHLYKIARFYIHDWIIVILLYVIDRWLNTIEPFHRFIGRDMMMDLRYPLRSETVPFRAVQIVGITLPVAIIFVIYFKRRNAYDLHHAVLGLLFSVLISAVLTDAIKVAVGRPRPNFFWRCFPDGKDVYDNITMSVICHGEKKMINEGHKSFPSGHSSWSFASLGFLSWYLAGKLRAFDGRGNIAKLGLVLLPLLGALFVAISRVDDYWHHWQDVFVGGLLGAIVASFFYLHFFPPPHDADGWFPHAYLQMLADAGNAGAPTIPNSHNSSSSSESKAFHVGPKNQGRIRLRDMNLALD